MRFSYGASMSAVAATKRASHPHAAVSLLGECYFAGGDAASRRGENSAARGQRRGYRVLSSTCHVLVFLLQLNGAHLRAR